MNPQEIQKQNFESSKTPEKKEAKNETNNIPKSSTLAKYPNFDVFEKTLKTLDEGTKNKVLSILESIPEDELTMYIEMDADSSNLITEDDIKRFIKEKDNYSNSKIFIENKSQQSDITKINETTKNTEKKDKELEENKKELEENKKELEENKKELEENKKELEENSKIEALETLKENTPRYQEIFGADSEFFKIFQRNENNPENLGKELENFLKTPENRKAIFDKLAATKDATLYRETYEALSSLSPTIAGYLKQTVPAEIYEVPEKGKTNIPTDIVSQFPNAKPEDIEKRGNLVSYGDKTIDIKTGKAYISGEKGYAIETSMKVPNSLDARVKYQKERLETLEEIKTNEKILTLVERKQTLKQNLEKLKSQKSSEGQNAQDLQIDIEINTLSKELEAINEKLKTIIPGYKEEQDEMFIRFLEEKIIQGKEKLISLKENFDLEMKELLEAGKDEIKARDEKVRDTMNFLDNLGITNINQNDLQKIINRINILPQAYGFSKKIDLKVGFQGTPTDALQQKKEFFKLFSKVYEKMNFIPPVNENIIQGFTKDERLKNDTIFKQKLEDIGVTKGGAIQIETMISLLGEKPKERERKYPGKPTPEKKAPHTVEVK